MSCLNKNRGKDEENTLRTVLEITVATSNRHKVPESSARPGEKVTAGTVKMAAPYLTHQQKVLRLYKKSLRHLESWCIFRYDEATALESRCEV